MKKLITFTIAIVLMLGVTETAKAENNLANHLDLFQVAIGSNGQPNFMDIGYHFTLLRINRFQLLGGGIGLNFYTKKDSSWDCECEISPFLIVPLASINLAKDRNDNVTLPSFSANFVYDTKQKIRSVAFGFSYSWR